MAKTDDKAVVGVDEGGVFTGPNLDGEYKGPEDGEDRAGLFAPAPNDEGIVLTKAPQNPAPAPKVGKSPKDGKRTYVFTNTRYPDQKLSIVREKDDVRHRTGHRVEFHSTKLATDDPEVATQVRDLNRPYIFEEPADYVGTDPYSDKMFLHKSTGFRTMVKKAYEDWVDNSEWSAKPR